MGDKILFLDIDGVLNSRQFLSQRKDSHDSQLDPIPIILLNMIIRDTGCKIVISSSWRHYHSLQQIDAMLAEQGMIFHDVIIGKTEDLFLENKSRVDEIQDWLHKNPTVKSFAIVDDDALDLYGSLDAFGDRFVKTDFATGLTIDHARKIISILNQ